MIGEQVVNTHEMKAADDEQDNVIYFGYEKKLQKEYRSKGKDGKSIAFR